MPNFSRTEKILLFIAITLGLFLRFYQLGALALTDTEAHWALQALALTRGGNPEIGANVAYVLLTALNFFVFDANGFFARFWPALIGGLLLFAPLLFTSWFSSRVMVILTFGLALDPGLVALSRLAGSSMPALSLLILSLGFWQAERPRWAGFFGGLALLSGASVWTGLLALGITALFLGKTLQDTFSFTKQSLPKSLASGLATFLLVGSLFFIVPTGISASFASVTDFFSGWLNASGVSIARLLLALPLYHLLPLGFGLAGLIRGLIAGDKNTGLLGIWFGVALALACLYPVRQVTDLVWALLPLWILAAQELSRHFPPLEDFNHWEVAASFELALTIFVFAWIGLTAAPLAVDAQSFIARLALFFGAFGLLGLSLALVALGWSPQSAKLAGVWSTLTALALFTFSAAWSAAGLRPSPTQELWQRSPPIAQSALLVQTMREISEWNTGVDTALPVQVAGFDSPALNWALRDFSVENTPWLDKSTNYALVISAEDPDSSLTENYRGQDFFWRQYHAWEALSVKDWITWITTRRMPFSQDKLILWADGKLFPSAIPNIP